LHLHTSWQVNGGNGFRPCLLPARKETHGNLGHGLSWTFDIHILMGNPWKFFAAEKNIYEQKII